MEIRSPIGESPEKQQGNEEGGLLYINFIIIFLLRYCGFSLSSQCLFMYCDITRGEFLLVEVTLVGS